MTNIDRIWEQYGSKICTDILETVTKDVLKKPKNLYQSLWFLGAADLYWLSVYEFGRRIGAEYDDNTLKRMEAYLRYTKTCGFAFLYDDWAFVSDRQSILTFDAQRRLHNEDGPAMQWPDGYSVYAWHGTRIPKTYITERFERTAADVMKIDNAEFRRVAMEIYAHVNGAERFIKDLKAKQISKDTDESGRPRILYQIGDARFLHVINGSLEPNGERREFILGAPSEMQTPHEAVAASYGRPAAKYKEVVRS